MPTSVWKWPPDVPSSLHQQGPICQLPIAVDTLIGSTFFCRVRICLSSRQRLTRTGKQPPQRGVRIWRPQPLISTFRINGSNMTLSESVNWGAASVTPPTPETASEYVTESDPANVNVLIPEDPTGAFAYAAAA